MAKPSACRKLVFDTPKKIITFSDRMMEPLDTDELEKLCLADHHKSPNKTSRDLSPQRKQDDDLQEDDFRTPTKEWIDDMDDDRLPHPQDKDPLPSTLVEKTYAILHAVSEEHKQMAQQTESQVDFVPESPIRTKDGMIEGLVENELGNENEEEEDENEGECSDSDEYDEDEQLEEQWMRERATDKPEAEDKIKKARMMKQIRTQTTRNALIVLEKLLDIENRHKQAIQQAIKGSQWDADVVTFMNLKYGIVDRLFVEIRPIIGQFVFDEINGRSSFTQMACKINDCNITLGKINEALQAQEISFLSKSEDM